MASFAQGETVKVTDFGIERVATVTRNNRRGIVFVRMHDTGRERWFHESSLRSA